MMWWHFRQSNPGGVFHLDNNLCENLFIEASTEEEAIAKAQAMGVYFNGVSEGLDCPCCNDRWDYPDKITEPVEQFAQQLVQRQSFHSPGARIFYSNGLIAEVSMDRVTLDEAMAKEIARLEDFKRWWLHKHQKEPDYYPLSFMMKNSGLWNEFMHDHDPATAWED